MRQDELESQLAKLEESQAGDTAPGSDVDGSQSAGWVPPRRGHGLPDAGRRCGALGELGDEEQSFGPAVELVREWLRLRTGGAGTGSRVEHARTEERRWELEAAMIEEFALTMPPETEPLDESRRDGHPAWRSQALERGHTGDGLRPSGSGCCGGC